MTTCKIGGHLQPLKGQTYCRDTHQYMDNLTEVIIKQTVLRQSKKENLNKLNTHNPLPL